MTKTELIKALATKMDSNQAEAGKAVDAFIEAIGEALAAGDKITLPGFGTFSVSERAERPGKNPQTGEAITIPASKVAKFKAGKVLKEQIS